MKKARICVAMALGFLLMPGWLTVSSAQCRSADTACWERYSREMGQRLDDEAADRGRRLDNEAADRAWEAAVANCTQAVRIVDSRFDAHVPAPGRVRMIGTTSARYAFAKCMAAAGQTPE